MCDHNAKNDIARLRKDFFDIGFFLAFFTGKKILFPFMLNLNFEKFYGPFFFIRRLKW